MVENGGSNIQEDCLILEDDEPPIFRPGWQFYSAMSIFMVLTVLESMNSTSTSTALVTLAENIEGTSTQYEWIGNSYMLAAGVLQLPIAALSNIFGRRPLILASFTIFTAGAICCGVSSNIQTLLAGRTLQGIGGAGTLVLPEIFVADVVPLRFRGMYFSLLSAMWSLGSGIGPIIGGGFSTVNSSSWRWIFYINIPICGIAIIATPFLIRLHLEKSSMSAKLKSIDFVGTILFVAAATSLVLGLSLGGVSYPWVSYQALLPVVLGALGLVAATFYELKVPSNPMFSAKVFGSLSASVAFTHVTVQGVLMEGLPYWLPMYYQGVKGYTPLISGCALLPFAGIIFVSALVSGWAVTRWGNYLVPSFLGWAILTMGLGLLLLLDENSSIGCWVGITIPISVGLGCLYSVQGIIVQAPNPPELWTDAAAMMSFCRSLGEALGVAMGGSIFSTKMKDLTSKIDTHGHPVDLNNAIELVAYIQSIHGSDTEVYYQLQSALILSMRYIYYTFVALSGLCFLLNLCLRSFSLDRIAIPKQGTLNETKSSRHPDVTKPGSRNRSSSMCTNNTVSTSISDTSSDFMEHLTILWHTSRSNTLFQTISKLF